MTWDEATVHITTRSEMWASSDTWHVVNSIEVLEDGETFFEGEWEFDVGRDHT